MSEFRIPSPQLGTFWSALGEPQRTDQPTEADVRRFLDRAAEPSADLAAIHLSQTLRVQLGLTDRPIGRPGLGSVAGHTAAPIFAPAREDTTTHDHESRAFLENAFAEFRGEGHRPYSATWMSEWIDKDSKQRDGKRNAFTVKKGSGRADYLINRIGEGCLIFKKTRGLVTIGFVAARDEEIIAALMSLSVPLGGWRSVVAGIRFNPIVKDRPDDEHFVIRDRDFGLFIPFFARQADGSFRFQLMFSTTDPQKQRLLSKTGSATANDGTALGDAKRQDLGSTRSNLDLAPGLFVGHRYGDVRHATVTIIEKDGPVKLATYFDTRPASDFFLLMVTEAKGEPDLIPFDKVRDRDVYLKVRTILARRNRTVSAEEFWPIRQSDRLGEVLKKGDVRIDGGFFHFEATGPDDRTIDYRLALPDAATLLKGPDPSIAVLAPVPVRATDSLSLPPKLSVAWFERLDPIGPGVFFVSYGDIGLKKFLFFEAADGSGPWIITTGREGGLVIGQIPVELDPEIVSQIRGTQWPLSPRVLAEGARSPFHEGEEGELIVFKTRAEGFSDGTDSRAMRAFPLSNNRFTTELVKVELMPSGRSLRFIVHEADGRKTERPALTLPEVDPNSEKVESGTRDHRIFTHNWYEDLSLEHGSVFNIRYRSGRVKKVFVSSVSGKTFGLIWREGDTLYFDPRDRSLPEREREFKAFRATLTAERKTDLLAARSSESPIGRVFDLVKALEPGGVTTRNRGGDVMTVRAVGNHLVLTVALPEGRKHTEYFFVSHDPFGQRAAAPTVPPFSKEWFDDIPEDHPNAVVTRGPGGDPRKYLLLKYEQPTGKPQIGLIFNRGERLFFKTLSRDKSAELAAKISEIRRRGEAITDEMIAGLFEEAGAYPLESLFTGLTIGERSGAPPLRLQISSDRIEVRYLEPIAGLPPPTFFYVFTDEPLIPAAAASGRELVPFSPDWFAKLGADDPHLFFTSGQRFFYLEHTGADRLGLITTNPEGKMVFVPLENKSVDEGVLISFIRGTQMREADRELRLAVPGWSHYPDGRNKLTFTFGDRTVNLPAFEIDTRESRAAEILDAVRSQERPMDVILNDIRHYWAPRRGGQKEEYVLTGLGPKVDEHVFLRLADVLLATGKIPDQLPAHRPFTREWFDELSPLNPVLAFMTDGGGRNHPFLLLEYEGRTPERMFGLLGYKNGVLTLWYLATTGWDGIVLRLIEKALHHPNKRLKRPKFFELLGKVNTSIPLPSAPGAKSRTVWHDKTFHAKVTIALDGERLTMKQDFGKRVVVQTSFVIPTANPLNDVPLPEYPPNSEIADWLKRFDVDEAGEFRSGRPVSFPPPDVPTAEELAALARERRREFVESAVSRLKGTRPPEVILPIAGMQNRDKRFRTSEEPVPPPIPIEFHVRTSAQNITKAADLWRKGIPPETLVMVRLGAKGSWIKYEVVNEGERLVLTPAKESAVPAGQIFLTRTHLLIEAGSELHRWYDRGGWGPILSVEEGEATEQQRTLVISGKDDPDYSLFNAIRPIWMVRRFDRLTAAQVRHVREETSDNGEWTITIPYTDEEGEAFSLLIDRTQKVYAHSISARKDQSIAVAKPVPAAAAVVPQQAADQTNAQVVPDRDPRPSGLRHAGRTKGEGATSGQTVTAPPHPDPLPPGERVIPQDPDPVEEETFNVASIVADEEGTRFVDIFFFQLTGRRNKRTGQRVITSGTVMLHHHVAEILGVERLERGIFSPAEPVELTDGLKIGFRYPGLDEELTVTLRFDEHGVLKASREPLLSDWDLISAPSPPGGEGKGEGGAKLIGHLLGEKTISLDVEPFPEGSDSGLSGTEKRFLLSRGSLPHAVFWSRFIGHPFPYSADDHSDIEVVLTPQGSSFTARFIPFKRNRDDSIPVRVRYLSDRERRIVEAAIGPSSQVEGAAADHPVEIRIAEFPKPSIEVDLIRPGEIFFPTPETVAWIRDLFLSRGSGRIPFADGTRLAQRLEFASDRGLVISIPIRWRNRPRNPFEMDVDHKERFVETFIRGQRETTLSRAGTDLRVHEQRGNWLLYIMTPVGDGRVKPFNLSLVISPQSPVLSALVNTLNEERMPDEVALFREKARRELARHLSRFFGGRVESIPTVYIPHPYVSVRSGRRIDLTFRGGEGETEAVLSGIHFSSRDGGMYFERELVLTLRDQTIRFEQTAGDKEGTLLLTEITDGSREGRKFQWDLSLGTIVPVREEEAAVPAEKILQLLDEAGLPVTRAEEKGTGERGETEQSGEEEGEETRFRQGTTLQIPAGIPPLPGRLSALPLPDEDAVIPLTDPDMIEQLLGQVDLHDVIFRPDETTLFAQALVGRREEMMTFGANGGVILQIPMIAEEEPPFRYLADEEADPVYQVKGATLLIPDPANREIVYEIPAAVFKQKTLGGYDQNLIELQIPGLAARNFTLEIVSSRETYGAKQVFAMVAKEIGRPSEVTDAHVRAYLKALVAAVGLDTAPNLYGSNVNLTGDEIVRLSDGRLLDLAIRKEAEGKFAIGGFGGGEGEEAGSSLISYEGETDGTRSTGRLFVYQAEGRAALFHLEDQEKGEQANLIVSADGDVWIWARGDLHRVRELLDPPYSANFPMVGIEGGHYATKARSAATRQTRTERGDAPDAREVFEITATLGRWDEAIAQSEGEAARIRFEVSVSADGTLAVVPGKIRDEEREAGSYFPFGDDFKIEIAEDRISNGRVRVVFHQPTGRVRERGKTERETPYGWLEFANREALIGDRRKFRVSRAHFHPIRFRETNLMPHDRGFLTKRAGVKVDENRFQREMFLSGHGEPVEPWLAAFQSTGASADDLPILLSAMAYLGLMQPDGNYDENLLASLAFFAASQNPSVSRDDLVKRVRSRPVVTVEPIPLPTVPAAPPPAIEERVPEAARAEAEAEVDGEAGTPATALPTQQDRGIDEEELPRSRLAERIRKALVVVEEILATTPGTRIGYSTVASDYRALKGFEGTVTPTLARRAVVLMETAEKMRDGTLYQATKDPLARLSAAARANPTIVKAVTLASRLLEGKTSRKRLDIDEFIEALERGGFRTLEPVWWPYVRELILRNRDRVDPELWLRASIRIMIMGKRAMPYPTESLRPQPLMTKRASDEDVDEVSEAEGAAATRKKKRGGGKGGAGAPPAASGGRSGGGSSRAASKGKKKRGAPSEIGPNDALSHSVDIAPVVDPVQLLIVNAIRVAGERGLTETAGVLDKMTAACRRNPRILAALTDKVRLWSVLNRLGHGYLKELSTRGTVKLHHQDVLLIRVAAAMARKDRGAELERVIGHILSASGRALAMARAVGGEIFVGPTVTIGSARNLVLVK